MYGSSKMIDRTTGKDMYDEYDKLITKFQDICKLICVHQPPANVKSLRSRVDMFNRRLDSLVINPKVQLIAPNISHLSKDNFLEGDGYTLSQNGAETFATFLKDEIQPPPTIKVKSEQSTDSPSQLPNIELSNMLEIQNEDIGKIIGTGGHIIKDISSKHKVKLLIGKWFEKRKGKSDKKSEYEEKFDGVVICGNASNVIDAIDSVKLALEGNYITA